jgi:predicted nucleic acid-binding protein
LGTLIDSSVFIAAERGDEPLRSVLALRDADNELISVVTVFELLHGVHRATPDRRPAREAFVEDVVRSFPVLEFDVPSARIFASVDAAKMAAGDKLPILDLMIASTALAHGHDVMTRDLKSFPRVPGLKLVAV